MTDQEIKELLKRFEDNKCTSEDDVLLRNWFLYATNLEELPAPVPDYANVKAKVFYEITGWPKTIRFTTPIRYAAAVIAIAGIGSILYFGTFRKNYSEKETKILADILPGSNKATLTLADGKRINLDEAKPGAITNQGGITVTKNKNGQIVYTLTPLALSGKDGVTFNSIRTPNGGQYQVILPDGSVVFLNAASTLKYPTQFTKNERKVDLTGEAYFQVTKDVKRPFVVSSQGQQVKVLGTQFNISVYPSETIKTTLAEGSVELTSSFSLRKQLLKPDQQATLLPDGFQLRHVNAQEEIAWKDGLFIFNQTSITDALRQISRWYDIEVDYSRMPNVTISAEISRKQQLSDVLNVLESVSGLKFTMKEGRLTIGK